METTVVAVVGGKNSGKTATIEAITKELTKRGYRVAAVKHIPEKDFTIDTKDKDTWRFAQSGAKTVVSIASGEIAAIEKTDTSTLSLKEILEKCMGNDIVLIEGFRKLLGGDEKVPKIVAVKSAEEALEASKTFKPIIAFTGPYSTEELALDAPYIDISRESTKIADIVEGVMRKRGF
ncbi:MAG: molybdopterin-guanine dinucleotide biosynthesis protein B [Candidatus Bathyarchaeales archaeon]